MKDGFEEIDFLLRPPYTEEKGNAETKTCGTRHNRWVGFATAREQRKAGISISILFLWDIDGTLIRAKGAGRRAMNKAFAELFGIPDAFSGIQMAGGLDLHFIHAAFHRHGCDTKRVPEFLERYFQALEQELRQGHSELLPGVKPILDRIDRQAGMYNCLGTGNLEKGARLKLGLFGLNRYFPVGGFCDSLAERHEVLQKGMARASAYYEVEFAPDRTIVIGDTVKDIEAARKIGATVIAVATGGHSLEALQAAQPDHLLPDLRDVDLFFSLVQKARLSP